MKVWIVTTSDLAQTVVFTTRKKAERYMYGLSLREYYGAKGFAIWYRPYNASDGEPFKAYLQQVRLVGAEHNYKHECKQLRATVRYLRGKIATLENALVLAAKYPPGIYDIWNNLSRPIGQRLRDDGSVYEYTPNGIYDKATGACIKSY